MNQNKTCITCSSLRCPHNEKKVCVCPGEIQFSYIETPNEGEYLYCISSHIQSREQKITHDVYCPFIACEHITDINIALRNGICSRRFQTLYYPQEDIDNFLDDDVRGETFICKDFVFNMRRNFNESK